MRVRWTSVLTVGLIGLFVVVRLAVRTAECLDGDEIFSLGVAGQSWPGLWSAAARDVSHPPLFYALLKVWIALGGTSLAWLRLLPTLIAIATLIPLWGLCRVLGIGAGERVATLAMVAMSGFLIAYSAHLRMFSLLQLASVGSLWAFARWLDSPAMGLRGAGPLLAWNALAIGAHYWGWVVVGCEGTYLLAFARRKVPALALIAGLLALASLPWAYAVVRAAAARGTYTSPITWIQRPHLSDVIGFYASLHGGFPLRRSTLLGLALFGTPIVAWAWAAARRGERSEAFRLLAWFAVVPVAFTLIASLVLPQSVWAERSLIICAVPYLMLVAVAACRLPGAAGTAMPLLLATWALGSGTLALPGSHKLRWDELAARLARTEPGASGLVPVYTVERFVAEPLRFYSVAQKTTDRLRIERVDPVMIDRLEGSHFWVVYRENSDVRWPLARRPEAMLADRGYRVGPMTRISAVDQRVWAVPAWKTVADGGPEDENARAAARPGRIW
jgi:hypothetical protein